MGHLNQCIKSQNCVTGGPDELQYGRFIPMYLASQSNTTDSLNLGLVWYGQRS